MAHNSEALSLVLDMIHGGQLDGAERELYDALRDRSNVRALQKRGSFAEGDHVTFNDRARKLHGLTGVVLRKLQKNISVEIDDTDASRRRGYAGAKFRCHPDLLDAA